RAFSQFDPEKVARYSEARIEKLTADAGIIRNRMKIAAAVKNARAFLLVQEEFGSFGAHMQAVGMVNDHFISASSWLIKAFNCAVWPGILTTVEQPAASERMRSATGEFHGTLIPATPIGSRTDSENRRPPHSAARP